MKTNLILTALSLSIASFVFGQKSAFELSFSAIENAYYVQLDSIKVMNRTQNCDTVMYWPDTVLILDQQVGIIEHSNESEFVVFPNYPNPVINHTTITFCIPEKEKVNVLISDMIGRQLISKNIILDKGYHSFRFNPCAGELFFFTAIYQGERRSIKILSAASNQNQQASLEYIGQRNSVTQLKSATNVQNFFFNIGDDLLYIGYWDNLQSGILDTPEESESYTFQFAYKTPCPGEPTVTYEGQVYNTVQIFSQCWLKENLNAGTMIPGFQEMTNNALIEKYCYDDDDAICDELGGLYQWNETMQYTTTLGAQGICPPGWHIPTDEEWKVLEGGIDGQYGIGDPEWDGWDFRGSDIGFRMRSESGWAYDYNGSDSHGFNMKPGGFRYFKDCDFWHVYGHAVLWTSNEDTDEYAWDRFVIGYLDEIYRNSVRRESGMSVRCIKD